MKLISFAVISLLAITASAQMLPSTSDVNYAPQPDQEVSGQVEKDELETKLVLDTARAELKQEGLSDEDKKVLTKKCDDAAINWDVAHVALTSRQRQLKEAQKESDDAEMKLKVQQENKKQLLEHNSQSQVKLETAPGSIYCTDILVKQSSEICQDASDLEFAHRKIGEGIDKLGVVVVRSRNPKQELLFGIQTELIEANKELKVAVTSAQTECAYTKKLLEDLGIWA
ncbi:hypothetical protein BASA50_004352 [Batrachochytrium salamandrivorans]|uniref:Uncharacterized protein n=1 Tax=Batrachochytrium salamandrivorans TaxID=1357716 RepID=A0ABQ8FFT2_9FUNG|nr:hypothetical protein BASA50_004352 [Batrachochytrium salamandrivorans]